MEKKANSRKMIIIFFILFSIIFIAVTARFIFIQAKGEVNNVSLKEWATDKREVSYPLKAERGKIYDNSGVMLAYDRPVFRMYAIIDSSYSTNKKDTLHVKDSKTTAKEIAKYLDVDAEQIEKKLEKAIKENEKLPIDERKFQIEFGTAGKNISQTIKNEIEKENIPGINFIEEAIRYYPNGVFASHIIGFARPDKETENDKIKGVVGMEKVKNKILEGKDGYISFHRDKFNSKLLNSKEVISEPEDGEDIHLTINQKVQILLEDVLNDVVEDYNPERITATIMNPKTGEIVATSNRPSYNPNKPKNVENWFNDAVSTPVEPGSTVKMFTWAAAIDAGVYQGSDTYKSGSFKIGPGIQAINDHNAGRGWGTISYDEGFIRSSNVAASKLAWEKLGPEKYLEYLKAFDFDKKTGIDLPSEVAGEILYNYPLEKITTAFGHGSTMTPIQQLKAATAIANEGKMMKPYVIKQIVDSKTNEIVNENKPEVVSEPISKDAAKQVLNLLGDVVNKDYGTGKNFKLKDYSVAGKTGTAQMPNPNGGGYLTGRENYIFSFLGMAPKEDPELIMHISVSQPKLKSNEVGSDITSYIFKNVMGNSLKYLNIESEKSEEEVTTVAMPNVIDKKTKDVEKELEENGQVYKIIGKGDKIVASNIKESTKILKNTSILLITNEPTVPNLTGWSKRELLELERLLNINLEIKGDGFVITQSIKTGKKLNEKTKLSVQLRKPF